jgi:hypothetical protein
MATATINLPVTAGVLPDGSTSNQAPQFAMRKGSETAPAKFLRSADFDAAQRESLYWSLHVPANWGSGLSARLHWMANATSGAVVWAVQVGAVTAADADTPIEHVLATASTVTTTVNTTEARRLVETVITFSSLDSLAAADELIVCVYRDGASGSDTCAVDAELLSVSLDYTTT